MWFYSATLIVYCFIQFKLLYRLRKHLHNKYESHKWQFIGQAFSIQLYMIAKITLDLALMHDFWAVKEDKERDFYLGSVVYFIQTILAFIVVLVKKPEDCFACFNRDGTKRTYSTY